MVKSFVFIKALKMLKMLKVLVAKSFVFIKVLKMVKMLKVLIEHLAPWMACCCSADSRRGPAPSTGSDDHRHSVILGSFRSYWVVACIDAIQGGFLPSSEKLFS